MDSKWGLKGRAHLIPNRVTGVHVGGWAKWVKSSSWRNIEWVLIFLFLLSITTLEILGTHQISALHSIFIPTEGVLIRPPKLAEVWGLVELRNIPRKVPKQALL